VEAIYLCFSFDLRPAASSHIKHVGNVSLSAHSARPCAVGIALAFALPIIATLAGAFNKDNGRTLGHPFERSSASQLVRRIQPCDSALLTLAGSGVP